MAEKLSVEIALEGGKEIESQLEDIGAAGKKAFSDISAAAAKAGGFDNLDPGEATKKMAEFGVTGEASINKIIDAVKKASVMETFVNGIKAVEGAFASLGTAVEKVITIMAKHEAASIGLGRAGVAAVSVMLGAFGSLGVTIGLVAVAVGVGLVAAFVAATKAIVEADAAAIKLGLTFAQFEKLKNSMSAAGISTKAFADGMTHLQSVTEQIKLDKVTEAFAAAQKNIAAGWPAATKDIQTLVDVAQGIGPASDAARKALETLGRPIPGAIDIQKTFDSIMFSAGKLADAFPIIAKELQNIPNAGDRFALMKKGIDELLVSADKAGKSALPDLVNAFKQLPPTIERNKLVLATLGDVLGPELIQALRIGGNALDQFVAKNKDFAQQQADAAIKTAYAWAKLRNAVVDFLNIRVGDSQVTTMLDAITNGVQRLGNYIANFSWSQFLADVAIALASASDMFTLFAGSIGRALGGAIWTGFTEGAQSAVNDVLAMFNNLIEKIKEAIRTAAELVGMKGPDMPVYAPGNAAGGMIGGRGTGTSDSNLAWVSRGEYITPARAVQQPGVLAFLEALRRTGGDLSSVMRGMGRFALGGLVSAPAFAGGGLNSMSHVTIAFPGLPPIGGLRASSSVVDQLQHAAAMAQVRSGGRKPSRYF